MKHVACPVALKGTYLVSIVMIFLCFRPRTIRTDTSLNVSIVRGFHGFTPTCYTVNSVHWWHVLVVMVLGTSKQFLLLEMLLISLWWSEQVLSDVPFLW